MIKKEYNWMKEHFFFCVAFKCTALAITKTFDFLSVIWLAPLKKFFWLNVINEHHREYSAMAKLQLRLSVLRGPWKIVNEDS